MYICFGRGVVLDTVLPPLPWCPLLAFVPSSLLSITAVVQHSCQGTAGLEQAPGSRRQGMLELVLVLREMNIKQCLYLI